MKTNEKSKEICANFPPYGYICECISLALHASINDRDKHARACKQFDTLIEHAKKAENELVKAKQQIERMHEIIESLTYSTKDSADALAFACARQVCAGRIDARSAIGDALLNYLPVGAPGGPTDVPEWMGKYAKEKGLLI